MEQAIYDIICKYCYFEIFKTDVFDYFIKKVIHIYYLRFNKEYKIRITKEDFENLKEKGVREVKI